MLNVIEKALKAGLAVISHHRAMLAPLGLTATSLAHICWKEEWKSGSLVREELNFQKGDGGGGGRAVERDPDRVRRRAQWSEREGRWETARREGRRRWER